MPLLLWNLFCCYWLMLTALSASSFTEVLINFSAGAAAVVLNPLLMLLPWYLAFLIAKWQNILLGTLTLPFFYIAFEYLHLHWELAWPWLTLGNAFSTMPWWIQFIEFTGTLGISLWIWIINLLLIAFLQTRKKRFFYAFIVFIILPLSSYAFVHLHPPIKKWLKVRIVQPNIDPYQKFEVLTPEEQIQRIVRLATQKPLDSVDLILLPETAIPTAIPTYVFQDSTHPLLKELYGLKKCILSGVTEVRIYYQKPSSPSARRYRDYWYEITNAAVVLRSPYFRVYQKAKLVPLVERIPYLEYLSFLKDFYIDLGGALGNLGKPDSLFNLYLCDGALVAPLICYESVFGDYVRQFVKKGAVLLAVMTNDGWWKQSSGYIQHAFYARLRAIETRRYVIRSANTGTSLAIAPDGTFLHKTAYGVPDVFDVRVGLSDFQTFYVRYGDYIGKLSYYISGIVLVVSLLLGRWFKRWNV